MKTFGYSSQTLNENEMLNNYDIFYIALIGTDKFNHFKN